MSGPDRAPRLEERWRMPLRVVAVFLAYVVYRLPGDDRLAAGLVLGVGALVLSYVAIDRLTLASEPRAGITGIGPLLLGSGLIVLGIALAVR